MHTNTSSIAFRCVRAMTSCTIIGAKHVVSYRFGDRMMISPMLSETCAITIIARTSYEQTETNSSTLSMFLLSFHSAPSRFNVDTVFCMYCACDGVLVFESQLMPSFRSHYHSQHGIGYVARWNENCHFIVLCTTESDLTFDTFCINHRNFSTQFKRKTGKGSPILINRRIRLPSIGMRIELMVPYNTIKTNEQHKVKAKTDIDVVSMSRNDIENGIK